MSNLASLKNDNLYHIETYEEKIDFAHHYMTLLGQNILKLAYKKSKVRDTGDEMAQNLLEFAQKDSSENYFRKNLKQFSYCLSAVEDLRDYNVEYINSKILNELRIFNETIKYSKTDLKSLLDAYNRDQPKKKGIFSIFMKSDFNEQLDSFTIENELALVKAKNLNDKLNEEIKKFENNKIKNIQKILSEYIKNELIFHDKVIKLYLNAFKYIKNDYESEAKTNMFKTANRRSFSESSLSTLNCKTTKSRQSRNFKFLSKDSNYSSSSNSSIAVNAINNNATSLSSSRSKKFDLQRLQRLASSEDDLFEDSDRVILSKSAPKILKPNSLKSSLKVYNETEL